MKAYSKQKRQRGMGILELLLGMGVAALIIGTVVAVAFGAFERAEADRYKLALTGFLGEFVQWQTRKMSQDCDGNGTNDAVTLNAAATITATTIAGTGNYINTRGAATAAQWNQRRRCRVMWQGLMSIVGRANEAGTGELASYDDDAVWEFYVGVSDAGYDLGLATADDAADIITAFGTIDGAADPVAAVPCSALDTPRSAMVVAAPTLGVCELVLPSVVATRGVIGAACTEFTTALPVAGTFSGEAAMSICT